MVSHILNLIFIPSYSSNYKILCENAADVVGPLSFLNVPFIKRLFILVFPNPDSPTKTNLYDFIFSS